MLFTNTECKIKSKKAMKDANEYRFIEFVDNDGSSLLFLPCSIKKFDTINVGFHSKLSVGKSKANNPKVVYSTEDTDLYLLIKSELDQNILFQQEDFSKIEVLAGAESNSKNGSTTIMLVKVLDDITLKFESPEDVKYMVIKNKYIKQLDNINGDFNMPVKLLSIK